MEFGKHLLDSGWAELNGDNITSGEEVSGDDGKVTQGGAGGTGGGNAGPASPSGTASPAGAAYNKGAAQPQVLRIVKDRHSCQAAVKMPI
jgi:hypothetical protein